MYRQVLNLKGIKNETSLSGIKRCISTEDSSDKCPKQARKDSGTETERGEGSLLICYHLERTHGSCASEIYQIGAKCRSGSFSKNILPQGKIDWDATKTNITIKSLKDDDGSRGLYDSKLEEYIPSSSSKESFEDFLKWIDNQKKLGNYKDVVLISHGHGHADMPSLVNNFARDHLMMDLLENVDMFCNSFKYFKTKFKTWAKFGLWNIYANVFPDRQAFKAHSALEHAAALYDILEKLNEKNDRNDFVTNIKQDGLNSNMCSQIATNYVCKIMAKWAKLANKPSGVVTFFAIQGYTPEIENPTAKHPVLLLNELVNEPIEFKLTGVAGKLPHGKVLTMSCTVQEKAYSGNGKSKKDAKKAAAVAVLADIYQIIYPNPTQNNHPNSGGSSFPDNEGSASGYSHRRTPPPPGEEESCYDSGSYSRLNTSDNFDDDNQQSLQGGETNKTGIKRSMSPDLTGDNCHKKVRKESTTVTEGDAAVSERGSLLISYDLELTDGSFASEIYQIGAKCSSGSFSRNILPQGKINWDVTKFATNITVKLDYFAGLRSLYDTKAKEYVPSSSSNESLWAFLMWIKEQKKMGNYKDVVLIAQGDTDMPALINNIAREGLMVDMLKNVDMFGDSLKYFQTNFKSWKRFKLEIVYANVFPDRKGFKAHSAIEDAIALHDILEKLNEKADRQDFVNKIKQESLISTKCVEIAKNKICKTLAKSANKAHDKNVIRFLAIQD